MAENNNLTLKSSGSNFGEIQIAPRVLEIIASIAAVQVKGVNRMAGSFSTSVNELFGHKDFGKGIKLNYDNDQLTVDIFVYMDYGASVPKAALEIQDRIKQQLLFMTELNVGSVNIHVEGIVPNKSNTTQIDPNHLFEDDDNKDDQK